MTPRDQKIQLREQAVLSRRSEEKLHSVLSPVICERVAETARFRNADWIAIYCARSWEVALNSLWALRPGHCVFPRTDPTDHSLQFYRIEKWADLSPGYGKILEPPANPSLLVSAWKSSDLVLVPGHVFDVYGGRIGSGMGCYDRFLAHVPAHRWGICFSYQIVNDELAQEPTDARMEALVSEMGFIPRRESPDT